MYRKLIILTLLLFTVLTGLFAQERTVQGRVTGENGEPLPGANVLVQGTTRGVITNPEGTYTIQVEASSVLTFSFVGFEPQDISVGNRTEINVTLKAEITDLEEIVVIGYGTQKRSHFSGAVAGISADKEKLAQIAVS